MEKPVFDAVYHAVKSALEKGDAPKQAVLPVRVPMASPGISGVQTQFEAPAPPPAAGPTARENAAAVSRDMLDALVDGDPSPAVFPPGFQAAPDTGEPGRIPLSRHTVRPLRDSTPDYYGGGAVSVDILRTNPSRTPAKAAEKKEEPPVRPAPPAAAPEEAAERSFPPFAMWERRSIPILSRKWGDSLFIIDKHAAHERMLYDRLRESAKQEAQLLLEPAAVTLSREEYAVLLSVQKELAEAGFEVEDFGGGAVLVRTVPMMSGRLRRGGRHTGNRRRPALRKAGDRYGQAGLDLSFHRLPGRRQGRRRKPSGGAEGSGRTGAAQGRRPLLSPRPSRLL